MPRTIRKLGTVMTAVAAGFLTFSLVLYPEEALQAAVEGMGLFWKIVFPSLLPFFVLSEVLLGLGLVHFVGVLLEPLMRPVFNVPGVGAFAMSMGLAAGYPMDAVITGKFRRKGMCTRIEGERLLAFTNTADPLFIFGAVAVGMFGLAKLGVVLGVAHYLSSFTVGFIFRFYRYGERGSDQVAGREEGNLLRRAARTLLRARKEDGRPFGRLLGEAVRESIATLLMICGFIMLFSVLVRIFTVFGVMRLITPLVAACLGTIGLSPSLVPAVLRGLLEIDLGTVAASVAAAPLLQRAVIASAVIAWSGLSVHGQVASVLTGTDIRMGPYVFARFCHAILAGLYTFAILAMMPLETAGRFEFLLIKGWPGVGIIQRFVLAGWQLALSLGGLIAVACLLRICGRYRLVWLRTKRLPARSASR
ncbi:MAG: sporulation integral membrane protein YlbJ [Bacteroidota bacterium]